MSPQAFVCSEPHLRGPMRKPENETKLYENKSEIHNPVCSLVVCNHLGFFVLHLSHKPKRRSHFLSGYSISKKMCCEWFIFHPFKTHSLFARPRMVLKHVLVVLRIVVFLCWFFLFFYPHLGRHFVRTPPEKILQIKNPDTL